jgi:hypothetical protein
MKKLLLGTAAVALGLARQRMNAAFALFLPIQDAMWQRPCSSRRPMSISQERR